MNSNGQVKFVYTFYGKIMFSFGHPLYICSDTNVSYVKMQNNFIHLFKKYSGIIKYNFEIILCIL